MLCPMSLETNATIVARTDYTPGLRTYFVQPDEPFESFESGQYVTLGLPSSTPRTGDIQPEYRPVPDGKMVLRAYSIASAGYETDALEFYIAHVPTGSLTPRIWSLAPGDRIQIGRRVVGSFTLENAQTSTAVLVGTGTGIAPFISMLRQHAVQRPDKRFVLLHGATCRKELAYFAELRALDRNLPNVTYLPAVSRPHLDPSWKGRTGRLTTFFDDGGALLAEVAGVRLDPSESDIYLCGSPGMVRDVGTILDPLGYTKWSKSRPGSLHIEEYWKDKE